MSEDLTDSQKIDRLYVAFTHPDTGFDAINRRLVSLESWRTGLVAVGTAMGVMVGAGFKLLLARLEGRP